jgi:ubiquinone/menaquinone biosynthesis C-methylase UbiE
MSINPDNEYTAMQREFYKLDSDGWSVLSRDRVVGSFDAHNIWKDYDCMFANIPNQEQKVVLDFACGPGRNMAKYAKQFAKIDGVDIDERNLECAKIWLTYSGLNESDHTLYLCNGFDLQNIPSDTYDIVMSTIAMQHICVYDIRLNYLKEFFRVLKSGGLITIQMGYGSNNCADYYDNNWNASATNGEFDVSIKNPDDLKKDLESIGYVDFSYEIKDSGPGDGHHPNWIYFRAFKP